MMKVFLVFVFLTLAFSLSAEEKKFEMSGYYLGLLHKGPKWTPEETPEVLKIQEGHMANINKMAEMGKLILAGPFTDNGDLRGVFILRVDSIEEAKALTDVDPAVQSGRLQIEWHPWFGAKNICVFATEAESKCKSK